MAKKKAKSTKVESIRHKDKRKNIPTAEYQSVVEPDQQQPVEMRYPRNTDLDPQLVWRGKDEQDWSDLVVQAPPLYIQEKVHPKVLIDDLLRQSREGKAQAPGAQAPGERALTTQRALRVAEVRHHGGAELAPESGRVGEQQESVDGGAHHAPPPGINFLSRTSSARRATRPDSVRTSA